MTEQFIFAFIVVIISLFMGDIYSCRIFEALTGMPQETFTEKIIRIINEIVQGL